MARSASSSSRSASASWRASSGGTVPFKVSTSPKSALRSGCAGAAPDAHPLGGTPAEAARAAASARACASRTSRSAASKSSRSPMLEPHRQRALLQRGARRLVAGERVGQRDRPLVPVDAHDQLEPDLLELDVALLGERQIEPQLRAPVDDRQLLREPV